MMKQLLKQDAKRPLFSQEALTAELRNIGFPEKAILNFQNCGVSTRHNTYFQCNCNAGFIPVKRNCHLRVCPVCSKKRQFKLTKQMKHFLNTCWNTKTYFWVFLTISPKNYPVDFSLDYYPMVKTGQTRVVKSGKYKGKVRDKYVRSKVPKRIIGYKACLIDFQRNFKKFLNSPYRESRNVRGHKTVELVRDLIKGGFYAIEVTENWKGKDVYDKFGNFLYKSRDDSYNFHVHMVIYSRKLDFSIRGKCMKCKQNYLKFDKFSHRFYCANRSCNSLNVVKYPDTKLGKIWRNVSGSSPNIYGERVQRMKGVASYLSKYISMNKFDFRDMRSFAEYVKVTYRQKLVHAFGDFYGIQVFTSKVIIICPFCKSRIFFHRDYDVDFIIYSSKPPPLLIDYCDYYEGVGQPASRVS